MSKKKIVIIGGPASGKTTVCAILSRLQTNEAVAFIGETASEYFKTVTSDEVAALSTCELQRVIFSLQIEKEDAAEELDAQLVICDRASADAYVYCSDNEAFEATGSTLEVLLARYEGVIILNGEKSNFVSDKDTKRLEDSYATVQALACRSRDVWSRHPNCRYVDQQPTVAAKARLVALMINELAGMDVFDVSSLG